MVMRSKLIYFLVAVFLVVILSYLSGTFLRKESNQNEQLNNQSCFTPTTLQPSTYFGGELNTRRESDAGNLLIRKDSNLNRDILTIYSKYGDALELWEEGSSNSMNPTISDNSITINLLNFTEKDLYIGDMVIILNEINPDNSKNLNIGMLHRIVDIKKENGIIYYQTKGDNNEDIDLIWWTIKDIHSKIVGILY